jgi:hypothetical protein
MNRNDYPTRTDGFDEDKIPTRWQYKRDTTTGQVSILDVPVYFSYDKNFKSGCIVFPK